MIKKLKEHDVIDPKTDKVIGKIGCDLREIMDKLNELVDAVNKHEDIIRQIGEWGSSKGECLWCDTLTEFNPEKPQKETFVSIDEALKMGKKVVTMSKCPVCGGDMIAGGICHYNLDCPIHDQNVPTEILELLDRTRKALDIAKDTIRHADWFFDGDYNVDAKTMHNEIKYAIKAITALEQKDVKCE